jgi:hypothetical protein
MVGKTLHQLKKKRHYIISISMIDLDCASLTVVAANFLVAHHLNITVVPAQVTDWQVTPIEADQHMPLHRSKSIVVSVI